MCNVGSDDTRSPLQAMACDQAARAGGVNTAVEAVEQSSCHGCGRKLQTCVISEEYPPFYKLIQVCAKCGISSDAITPEALFAQRDEAVKNLIAMRELYGDELVKVEQLRDALELAIKNMNVYAANAAVPESQQMTRDRLIALARAVKLEPARVRIIKAAYGIGRIRVLPGEIYDITMNPCGAVSAMIDGEVYLGLKPDEFEWYEGE